MLAGAVRTYLNRFAVAPGTARRRVRQQRRRLAHRARPAWPRASRSRPWSIRAARRRRTERVARRGRRARVQRRRGRRATRRPQRAAWRSAERGRARGIGVGCDLLAMSGGWNPTLHLTSPSRRPAALGRGASRPSCRTSCRRAWRWRARRRARSRWPRRCARRRRAPGAAAADDAGHAAQPCPASADAEAGGDRPSPPLWLVRGARARPSSISRTTSPPPTSRWREREGFRAVEHLKRYTTLGMATDQGKTANVNGLALMAELTGNDHRRDRHDHVPPALHAGRDRGAGRAPSRARISARRG